MYSENINVALEELEEVGRYIVFNNFLKVKSDSCNLIWSLEWILFNQYRRYKSNDEKLLGELLHNRLGLIPMLQIFVTEWARNFML